MEFLLGFQQSEYGSKPGSVSLWVSDVQVWVKGRIWFADPSAVFPIGICGASITWLELIWFNLDSV